MIAVLSVVTSQLVDPNHHDQDVIQSVSHGAELVVSSCGSHEIESPLDAVVIAGSRVHLASLLLLLLHREDVMAG